MNFRNKAKLCGVSIAVLVCLVTAALLSKPVWGWRWLNRVYAGALGYFWIPCPICGQMFGGHEMAKNAMLCTERQRPLMWSTVVDGRQVVTTNGFTQCGKGVCWRCADKATALNIERGMLDIETGQDQSK